MITLSKSGNSVTFTFDENSGYLQNGTIDVPVNSLALIIDESDMATFRKSASNDIFISARYEEFGMSKVELEAWYKENMVGSTGGGVDSGTVQTMIDESISGLAESSAVTEEISEAVSGKVDTTTYTAYTAATDSRLAEDEEVSVRALNDLDERKLDASAYTPVDLSDYYTTAQTDSKIAEAVSGKQDTLVSGTNIKTINNESILGSGNITIQGGGGGMTEDMERLISTALVDLNDRKIDASEVKSNYQKKGDYATKSALDLKANSSEVMTLDKSKENELVTAAALNSINERLIALETAVQALQTLHNNE